MSRVEHQYVVTPVTLNDGDFTVGVCDANGRAQIAEQFAPQAEDNTNGVIAQAIKPLAVSTYAPNLYTNFGAQVTQNMKATPGNLFSFVCTNANAAVRYIQFHDTATTPAGAAVPKVSFAVPASGGTFTLGRDFFSAMGVYFATGIAMAFSTTAGTYTAGAAADVTLHATFI